MTPDDLHRLSADVRVFLDPMICRTPEGVGGSQPGMHCAACCAGSGFSVGSQEELDLARLLARVDRALPALIAAARETEALRAENERLRHDLEEAQLRSIEARNPGIDMDEVRRIRGAEHEAAKG